MHGAAFRALGLDAVFVALPASGGDVAPVVRTLCRSGGGASIMAPNKGVVAALLDVPSDRVRTVGACNAVWGEPRHAGVGEAAERQTLAGDNTDVDGVLASMRELGIDAGAWLVAGTGGAARAAGLAAREAGARMAVDSRDPGRRARFMAWLAAVGVAPAAREECVVLVNATPLGRRPGDPLPIDAATTPRAIAAFDMVYAAGETPWVTAMRRRGLRAVDGRTMLLGQGMAAFAHWFPQIEPPGDVMRAAIADALR
jgi:shikimate dehydrogenase